MHMDPYESKSARNRRKIILHNKLHRKATKLTGRTSYAIYFFWNIELKFIVDDLISWSTSDKNCSKQSPQTTTISYGEANSVLTIGKWGSDCWLIFTANVLKSKLHCKCPWQIRPQSNKENEDGFQPRIHKPKK